MHTDYTEWLSLAPYGWTQAEKESRYLPYLKDLTELHRQRCSPYSQALSLLGYTPKQVKTLADIPLLPISLFKMSTLKSISQEAVFKVLTSSGTSGQAVSHIFLDAATAQNQQLVLYSIVKNFIPSARLPMLILDSPSTLTNRAAFTARGAAILGFSLFAKNRCYALKENMEPDVDAICQFAHTHQGKPVIIFGFTFMIWQYLCQALQTEPVSLDFSNAIAIHGGGWKKMQEQAVSPPEYKRRLKKQFGITRVHNYYGMTEQTGCIYMECEYGHLHASIFSDILIRSPHDFSLCPPGTSGLLQVVSPMPLSYPGHSLLTEDMGTLLGVDDCPCGRKGNYFSVDGRIPSAEIRGCSDTYVKQHH